ncbi:MAG: cupin domain-containing protein [Dehalococcoidia bacterium]
MVERVVERGREPEPEELVYEYIYRWRAERKLAASQGKVVIKGTDVPWEQNRQGYIKFYLHPRVWQEVSVPNWFMFIHDIRKNSGRHRHQGGLGLFVLEGKGYTVVDGVRYDWEAGDLVILPVKPDGCEHQHFNAEPGTPAMWLALIFDPFRDAMGNELEQKEVSPDWQGGPTPMPHVA